MYKITKKLDLDKQEINKNDILNIIENTDNENPNDIFFSDRNEEINKEEQIDGEKIEKNLDKKNPIGAKNILSSFTFIFKYLITSIFIFAVLLLTANYSAYTSIAKNYFFEGEIIETQKSLISSVKASVIKEKIKEKVERKKMFRNEKDLEVAKNEYKANIYSMSQLMNKANREDIKVDIDISPYENRIVIPKIGKNIPLIDIKRKFVSGKNELNDIFMEELKDGVVRYPGSVRPGNIGNTFIFGHSSNFPWVAGDYNEVFAGLDRVVFNDDIIIYYGQKKFTYKVTEKKVIRPGNVGVIKSDKGKKEITLMTCWPVGTTLNRLIVKGVLVEE